MPYGTALSPNDNDHSFPQEADGHHPHLAVVETVIFLFDTHTGPNIRRISKIQPSFTQSLFALRRIEADVHMPLNMIKVNCCIYNNSALPGPSIERKHLAHILRDDPLMAPEKDAGEDISIRRRRMRYRAWHRGTREMDLVLGPFADAFLSTLDEPELDRLEALMDEEDTDLLKWVMGQEAVPPHADAELLGRIVAYRLKTE